MHHANVADLYLGKRDQTILNQFYEHSIKVDLVRFLNGNGSSVGQLMSGSCCDSMDLNSCDEKWEAELHCDMAFYICIEPIDG